MNRTVVILNPASAGGRTGARWAAVRAALESAGVMPEMRCTSEPLEATALTRTALREGFTTVVAMGGDGTLNEVVNGYFDPLSGDPINPEAAIGLIPSGTGGDFRRSVRIPSTEDAVTAIAKGRSHPIDVGRIETDEHPALVQHYINIADWGVGGDVVARVNASRFKGGGARGSAVFLGISLQRLLTYDLRTVEITIDDQVLERRVSNVVVANGRYFGGGMRIAPQARLDDGLFDVVIVGEMSRMQTIAGIPRIYRGSHLTMPGIEVYRGRRVVIRPSDIAPLQFEAEGELIGAGAATVTCLPGAVRFIVN